MAGGLVAPPIRKLKGRKTAVVHRVSAIAPALGKPYVEITPAHSFPDPVNPTDVSTLSYSSRVALWSIGAPAWFDLAWTNINVSVKNGVGICRVGRHVSLFLNRNMSVTIPAGGSSLIAAPGTLPIDTRPDATVASRGCSATRDDLIIAITPDGGIALYAGRLGGAIPAGVLSGIEMIVSYLSA